MKTTHSSLFALPRPWRFTALRPAALPLFVGLALACGAVTAVAGAAFERTILEIEAGLADETVEANFSFRNLGSVPLRVTSVRSNCSCLLAEGPEGPVAPGEEGRIRGVFKTGNYSGRVEKHLFVTIEGGPRPSQVPLTVAVTIPKVIEIDPPTLRWTLGEEFEEKAFNVRMVIEDEPIRLLEAICSRPQFEIRTEEVEAGRHYRVFVRPEGEFENPMLGLIRFTTDSRFERFRNPMAFLSVERPKVQP